MSQGLTQIEFHIGKKNSVKTLVTYAKIIHIRSPYF